MQVDSLDNRAEREILRALVTSTPFLARVSGKLAKDAFAGRPANIISGLCLRYFAKYHRAPERRIGVLFEDWAKRKGDPPTIAAIEKLLSSLSAEEERNGESNGEINHILDTCQSLLDTVSLGRLQEGLLGCLRRGDHGGAELLRSAYQRTVLTTEGGIDVLRDKAAQKRAHESAQKVLISYPGPAGVFFGSELAEDAFVGIMGPPKGLKSYCMLDLAWQAVRQGKRTAYFQIGDLTEGQILRRFQKRAANRPLTAKTIKWPTAIMLPAGEKVATVQHEDKVFTEPLTWEEGQAAFARMVKGEEVLLRLFCHPVLTVSILDVQTTLKAWDQEGWFAQVVIIDYAENLRPIDNKANSVDSVIKTWAISRQISQERKCLVVEANQTNKEGFKTWSLGRGNFRGSLMTLAHVTAFLGINATEEERNMGVFRYNWIFRREEEHTSKHLHCASCIDCARPIVLSVMG